MTFHANLTRDNPRLLELEAQYAALNLPFAHSLWESHQRNLPIGDFRSDGAYLGTNAQREDLYRATFEYVVSIDKSGYLDVLQEDEAFGCPTYDFPYKGGTKTVSRDLLDSIMELYFVQEALGVMLLDDHWLDIGAGYGRFAYRLNALYPQNYITCVDAVPLSTFLCERYMHYRGCADRAKVLPLSQIDKIERYEFDIACNIHSWSECSSSAISFWLSKIDQWRIPYLFLVPHDPRFVCVEPDGSIGNFQPLIAAHGYKLKYSRPKYPNGVNGLYPEVWYYLYERFA